LASQSLLSEPEECFLVKFQNQLDNFDMLLTQEECLFAQNGFSFFF